ncbi:MAG: hypothetical protein SFV53_05830 [Rickettsiales bacterium]|nr:hypothetical protein [Rickettsiales bacterium]
MKKIIILTLTLLLSSCFSSKPEDPLILPPNFDEMPDLNNPEKPTPQQQNENVNQLKELLLKSD